MTQRSSSSGDQFSTGGSTGRTTADTGSTQPFNTPSTSGSMGAQGSTTQEIMGQASNITDQAKEQAGQLADQARTQVTSRISGQKDRAAEGLGSVAQALRHTGYQLRDQDQSGMTQYVDQVADQVERLSNYIKYNEVGDLVDDVERFARQQPALFIGGAFTLGLLAARFLKSSSSNRRSSYTQRGYTGSRLYDSRYEAPRYSQGYTAPSGMASPYGTTAGTSDMYGGAMGSSGAMGAGSMGTTRTGLVGENTSDTGAGSSVGMSSSSTTRSPGMSGTSRPTGTTDTGGKTRTTGSTGTSGTSGASSTQGSTQNSRERGGKEGL
jgi:hypothetical protein